MAILLPHEFLLLFPQQERIAIQQSAKTDPYVYDALYVLQNSQYVDTQSDLVRETLMLFASKKLIDKSYIDEISGPSEAPPVDMFVKILPPFGDGKTIHQVTRINGENIRISDDVWYAPNHYEVQ